MSRERNLSNISRLILGTAQLGMSYGLKHQTEIPEQKEVDLLLSDAWDSGVYWLDTAEGYGRSEVAIGSWHRDNEYRRFQVCTKVSGMDSSSRDILLRETRNHIERCTRKLDIDQIDIVMWHDADFFISHRSDCSWVMSKLKCEGLIKKWGVSAYPYHDFSMMYDAGLDVIQIPLNALDSRLIRAGTLKRISEAGIEVHARSIFLQGLLTRKSIPANNKMYFCSDALSRYNELCKHLGRSSEQLAIDYITTIPDVTKVVIGCRNQHQYNEVISWVKRTEPLSVKEMEIIQNTFESIDQRIITPTMW